MHYREEKPDAKEFKAAYRDSLEALITKRQKDADAARAEFAKDIFTDRERYVDALKNLLGWPLTEAAPAAVREPKSVLLSVEDGYNIYRLTFDILDGVLISGLFLQRTDGKARPLVLCQHGALGTPELICGVFESGSSNYNDMAMRTFAYDVNVFAPQLILWGEAYEAPFNRDDIDSRLRALGSSITAVEIYGLQRILDYFEKQNYVTNFGMVGLSYGGFYTLFTTALDTRIRAALSCSYFNDRNAVGNFLNWRWAGGSFRFHDAEIAAMIYPRPLAIAVGDQDEVFLAPNAQKEFQRLCAMCGDVGTDWVDFEVFEGTHEFIKDEKYIQKVVEALK